MNLGALSNQLTKIYNTLGNQWLTGNFETEPFDFRVFVKKGDSADLTDYVIEVYSDPPFPKNLKYRKDKGEGFNGIHYSVVKSHFKELAKYIDTKFGSFGKTLGVTLMDLDWRDNDSQ